MVVSGAGSLFRGLVLRRRHEFFYEGGAKPSVLGCALKIVEAALGEKPFGKGGELVLPHFDALGQTLLAGEPQADTLPTGVILLDGAY